MSNLNVCIFYGHLVGNAELSYWQDQTPYCRFSIANNKSWKNQNGEYESLPSYFDLVMKGKYAETMAKYLTKGRGVKVVTRAKQNRWEKDGQKYSKIIFEVQDLELEPTGDQANKQFKPKEVPQNDYSEVEPEYIPFDDNSEDIPF